MATINYSKPKDNAGRGEVRALWNVVRDSRTPVFAKILPILVLLYVLSPIDFIPDFIPIAGYLDDALLIPLGMWLALKLVPEDVFQEVSAEAHIAAKRLKRTLLLVSVSVGVFLLLIMAALVYLILLIVRSLQG